MELDRIDFALVAALQQDASRRLEDLGREVGMAPSSVHDRIRRLESAGVIERWTVECEAALLGLGVLAFIGVQTTRPCTELVPFLDDIEEIEECHSVAGTFGMLLKVRVANPPALLVLTDRLRQIAGVEGTQTTIVLATQFDRPFHASFPEPQRKRRASPQRPAAR